MEKAKILNWEGENFIEEAVIWKSVIEKGENFIEEAVIGKGEKFKFKKQLVWIKRAKQNINLHYNYWLTNLNIF